VLDRKKSEPPILSLLNMELHWQGWTKQNHY